MPGIRPPLLRDSFKIFSFTDSKDAFIQLGNSPTANCSGQSTQDACALIITKSPTFQKGHLCLLKKLGAEAPPRSPFETITVTLELTAGHHCPREGLFQGILGELKR